MRSLLLVALLGSPLLAEGTISYRKTVMVDPGYRSRFTAEEIDRILGAAPPAIEVDAEKVALSAPERAPDAELISVVEPAVRTVEYVEPAFVYDRCDVPAFTTVALSWSDCGRGSWYGGRARYGYSCYRPAYRSSWCGPRWGFSAGTSFRAGCGTRIGFGIGFGY